MGFCEGFDVIVVGLIVGVCDSLVGLIVGVSEGLSVGLAVGWRVGFSVGEKVGCGTGLEPGEQTWVRVSITVLPQQPRLRVGVLSGRLLILPLQQW